MGRSATFLGVRTLTFNVPTSRSAVTSVVTMTNTGTAPLQVTGESITANSARFSVTGTTCSFTTPLAAGGTCTVSVRYATPGTRPFLPNLGALPSPTMAPRPVCWRWLGNSGWRNRTRFRDWRTCQFPEPGWSPEPRCMGEQMYRTNTRGKLIFLAAVLTGGMSYLAASAQSSPGKPEVAVPGGVSLHTQHMPGAMGKIG